MGMMIEKNFNLLISMAQQDVTNLTYLLEVLGEGFQSMSSIPMLCSFEAFENLHNHHMKGGN